MSAPIRKNYHCDLCPNSFARSEHLQRHRRTHTREKPFACDQCPSRFSRTDLLRRHGIAHHGAGQDDSAQDGRAPKRQRIKFACHGCNVRKLKCDEERPCGRCREKQIECVSSQRPPSPPPPGSTTQGPDPDAVRQVQGATHFDLVAQQNGLQHDGVSSVLSQDRVDVTHPDGLSMLARIAQHNYDHERPDTAANPALGPPVHDHSANAQDEPVEVSRPMDRSVRFSLDQGRPGDDLFQMQDDSNGMDHVPSEYALEHPSHGGDDWMNIPMFLNSTQDPCLDILQNMSSVNNYDTPYQDFFEGNYADSVGPVSMESVDTSLFTLQAPFVDYPNGSAKQTMPPKERDNARSRLRALSEVNISRAPSPSHQQERNQWLASLGEEDPNATAINSDRLIVDEFLRLFQTHIANWFSCFRDTKLVITKSTRREWYLAMAAVGALYCPIEGSQRIAKWLYHCSRQMLFSYVYREKASSSSVARDGISALETYILLQMFGYLSGDKRIYELTEALHPQTMEAARELNLFEPGGLGDEQERTKLLESLLTLDCYRVVILQRPPLMPLFNGPRTVFDGEGEEDSRFGATVVGLTTSGSLAPTFSSPSESYRALCALGTYSWESVRAHGPRRTLWSPGFCNNALDQWMQSHDSMPSPGFMILFHATHINMLVSWPAVQNIAVAYLNQPGGRQVTTDRRRSLLPTESAHLRLALDDLFLHTQERPKVRWHALQVLRQALRGQSHAHNASEDHDDDPATIEDEANGKWENSEAPHFSHCVCLATLTLWCYEMSSKERDEKAIKLWLETGLDLLQDRSISSLYGIQTLFSSIMYNLYRCIG